MERCAIVGIGQTEHRAKREDVSIPGLLREAAMRALADADLAWKDIDAVVIGTAPDMFEGIMMPELFLADALGAVGKPISRVHTAGSVGGSTALIAAELVHAGIHERVLTLAFEKQSESDAMWALSPSIPFQPQLVAGAGGYFAPLIRAYMRRSGAPPHVGHLVAVKDRQNGLKNPFAHLRIKNISQEMVAASPMLWDPIRYLDTCPSSDGAVAMVLGSEGAAKKSPRPPAWVHGGAMRSEPVMFSGRDQVNPRAGIDRAKDVYAQARITNPRKEIDVAEIYVPFSWFEPMWLENLGFSAEGEGWKMTDSGATALGGDLPVNASGGVLCTNPIGASGMLRFAEAAMQVRGDAGEHQVDGAKRALGHAYGGGSQFFAMWIVGSDKPGAERDGAETASSAQRFVCEARTGALLPANCGGNHAGLTRECPMPTLAFSTEVPMTTIPEAYRDLLTTKKSFANLATVMSDGTPQVTPIWIDFDGTHLIVNSAKGRLKDKNLRARSEVGVAISDPENPYRYLGIQGKVVEITEAGADEHIDKMAMKYMGKDKYPFRTPTEVRCIYKIEPLKVHVMG